MIKAEIHPLAWAVRAHHQRRLWQEQFQVCADVWVELGSNGRRCAGGNNRALTPAGLAGAGGRLLRGEGGPSQSHRLSGAVKAGSVITEQAKGAPAVEQDV